MAADSYTALVQGIEAKNAEVKSGDVTRVSRLALRDGAIALAALSLWAAGDAWYAGTHLTAAALLSVLTGLAAGYGLGLLAHEWGHFAGARWGGGIAPTTKFTQLFPIFLLDMQRRHPGKEALQVIVQQVTLVGIRRNHQQGYS